MSLNLGFHCYVINIGRRVSIWNNVGVTINMTAAQTCVLSFRTLIA